ncbi:MAG: SpoVG family protein [Lachnospiraceae bacterium]|nr:SpoVG family protein [Lachnospiraceae bacterium]
MEYTIRFTSINKGKLLGKANIVFENQFKVNNALIFAGKEEGAVAVAMPSYQKLDPVTGAKTHQPVVLLSKELGERVRNSIKEMVNASVFNVSSNPAHLAGSSLDELTVSVKNITPFDGGEKSPNLRGFANMAIGEIGSDDKIHVNSITIRELVNAEGQAWHSASMPRGKSPGMDGNPAYFDQAHPITGTLRNKVNAAIIDEYKLKIGEHGIGDNALASQAEGQGRGDAMSGQLDRPWDNAKAPGHENNAGAGPANLEHELDANGDDLTFGGDYADELDMMSE